nr:hypothetical protein [uncultured Pseudomonas sp.]
MTARTFAMRPHIWLYLALMPLAGCDTRLPSPSYSPEFQALRGAGGRAEIVPVQCLQPAPEDGRDEQGAAPLLVPGCANNLTLLQMVENRSDVLQGRLTGPTMAAPVGRAAQVYIDGYDREELRRRQAEQQARADQQEAQ